jgi:GxxExxY protein
MDSDADRSNKKKPVLKRGDLILPELSYKIVGVLFDVYNVVGPGHLERVYQRAVAEALKERKLKFIEQVSAPLVFKGKAIGKYLLDFLIEDKVVLELKQGDRFRKSNIDQVLAYLASTNRELAILANFTQQGVLFRRIVNSPQSHS